MFVHDVHLILTHHYKNNEITTAKMGRQYYSDGRKLRLYSSVDGKPDETRPLERPRCR